VLQWNVRLLGLQHGMRHNLHLSGLGYEQLRRLRRGLLEHRTLLHQRDLFALRRSHDHAAQWGLYRHQRRREQLRRLWNHLYRRHPVLRQQRLLRVPGGPG